MVRAAGARPRPPRPAPRAAGRAGRPGGGRRRGHPHLHLGDHRAAQGGHADRGQRRLRHQGPRRRRRLLRESRPRRRHPVLPAAVPRRRADRHRVGERRRRHPGPLRRVDRDRPGQPARGPADPVLRRAPHLGEDPGHGRDPDGLGVPAETGQLPAVDGPGGPDRGRAGGQRRHPHPLDPAALRPRLPVPVPVPAQTARPAALPLRGVGGGADRPRAAPVVLRARGGHPRDLRHDREQRRGHRQPSRPDQGRHRRRGPPRGRAPPRPGNGRDPDPPPRCVRRLLGQARADRRGAGGRRLAAHRRRRRVGRRHPPQDRRPAQGHPHHLRRQERLPVRDRELAQVLPLCPRGGGGRRPPPLPDRPHRHRAGHGGGVGPAPPHPLHHLPRPVGEAGGAGPRPGGGGRHQPAPGPLRDRQAVPAHPQGARPRGRRADRHPEGQAGRHHRRLRRPHRGHVPAGWSPGGCGGVASGGVPRPRPSAAWPRGRCTPCWASGS